MNRTAISNACAFVGVVLVVLATLDQSIPMLMTGLALLLASHILTPCIDRIVVWRKKLLK